MTTAMTFICRGILRAVLDPGTSLTLIASTEAPRRHRALR